LRRAIACIGTDEEGSLQELLKLAPRTPSHRSPFDESFDARSAQSRLGLLALSFLNPRDLSTGLQFDVATLLEASDLKAFPLVFERGRTAAGGLENRLVHPPSHGLKALIQERCICPEDQVLRSHAISVEAALAFTAKDFVLFLKLRREGILAALQHLGARLAEWSPADRDRPSIDYLVRPQVEEVTL